VDAREKGGQQPFEASDAGVARAIAGELVAVASSLGLVAEPGAAEPEAIPDTLSSPLPEVEKPDEPVLLDLPALADLTGVAAEAVLRDRVYAIALTVAMDQSATTLLFGSADGDEGEAESVRNHQTEALIAGGLAVPKTSDWTFEWRRVAAGAGRPRPSLIVSAIQLTSKTWSLVTSVVGAEDSSDPSVVLERLQRELEAVHQMSKLRFTRRSLAHRLLQPGEARYSELLTHSAAVSRLCWQMAHAAGADHEQAELAAITGLLHDVGMRELDYDNLYRVADPSSEQRAIYRRHPVVGEAIVRGVGLESVADAVKHHHERWDGKGYPDRVAGDGIPWLARLVHVAEVFDVLTSPTSYLEAVSADRALSNIESASGRQFDPEVVELLVRVVT
jgi:putative nucleotidyltransferase with HDIG domain